MELVGAAASITGILAFAGQAIQGIQKLRNIFQDCATASKSIDRFLRDLNTLIQCLEVKDIVAKLNNASGFVPDSLLTSLEIQLEDCSKDVHLWVTKAGEAHPGFTSGTKAVFKKLLVALKKDDYYDVYREISSHRHNIMAKLSVIGRSLDIENSSDLKNINSKLDEVAHTAKEISEVTIEKLDALQTSFDQPVFNRRGSSPVNLVSIADSLSRLEQHFLSSAHGSASGAGGAFAFGSPPEMRQHTYRNHMDYTGHANRIMFTMGQVARMHATLTGARASFAGSDFFEFVLQTGTALHETDNTFKFLMGDMNKDGQPDLVAIKKSGTGSKSTEVHVLSGTSGFKTFTTQTGSGLHETSTAQFDFALTDWNGDGTLDLVAIKKNGTDTKSTEVHILSGASKFQNFILQTGTALHETDDTFAFAMGKWDANSKPDLFAIKKSKTGTKSTEVHVLSGALGFKKFILQTGTGLHETDATFDFAVTDWNADGRPDLVAVKKSNTSKNSTEVHVLSGASNYKNFILHSETALHRTDGTFEFAVADWTRNGRLDLVAIKKRNTGSNSTEVHIMAG